MTTTQHDSGGASVPPDGPIGLMGAMPEETRAIIDAMTQTAEPMVHGGRTFYQGRLSGRNVVVATSRCGKVAAGATATELIVRFDVSAIVFTGVAGGLGDGVGVGDVVVASELAQHDMDASPLFPKYEIPLLSASRLAADLRIAAQAELAIRKVRDRLQHPGLDHHPQIHRGLIVSGDQFVASTHARDTILAGLPDALCVEMEGAAVAQVAFEYGVPVCVVRTISDTADHAAPEVFLESLGAIAADHANAIVAELLQDWPLTG